MSQVTMKLPENIESVDVVDDPMYGSLLMVTLKGGRRITIDASFPDFPGRATLHVLDAEKGEDDCLDPKLGMSFNLDGELGADMADYTVKPAPDVSVTLQDAVRNAIAALNGHTNAQGLFDRRRNARKALAAWTGVNRQDAHLLAKDMLANVTINCEVFDCSPARIKWIAEQMLELAKS